MIFGIGSGSSQLVGRYDNRWEEPQHEATAFERFELQIEIQTAHKALQRLSASSRQKAPNVDSAKSVDSSTAKHILGTYLSYEIACVHN